MYIVPCGKEMGKTALWALKPSKHSFLSFTLLFSPEANSHPYVNTLPEEFWDASSLCKLALLMFLRKVLGEVSPDLNYCRLSWATATILAWGKPSGKAVVSLNSLASSSMPAVCPGMHPLLRRKGQKARLEESLEEKTKGNWNEKQRSVCASRVGKQR